MEAQLNLGFLLTPEFVWTQEVIILFIWPFTGINMVKIYGKVAEMAHFAARMCLCARFPECLENPGKIEKWLLDR